MTLKLIWPICPVFQKQDQHTLVDSSVQTLKAQLSSLKEYQNYLWKLH